ncbi:uncharacterized protein A4U43_C08F18720 [Asparagus officinalis]|nr:uncharacterized protein A4U43_C08F18720 [Asparagus officinalis]
MNWWRGVAGVDFGVFRRGCSEARRGHGLVGFSAFGAMKRSEAVRGCLWEELVEGMLSTRRAGCGASGEVDGCAERQGAGLIRSCMGWMERCALASGSESKSSKGKRVR